MNTSAVVAARAMTRMIYTDIGICQETVPAWFVSPWLIVPAIIGSELAWIVIRQVMWLRLRSRRR